MASLTRFLAFAIAPLLGVACQDFGPPTPSHSASSSDLTQDQFTAAFQDLACKNLKQCCSNGHLGFDTGTCPTLFANAGQGSGNAVFNPANAERCLTEMTAMNSCGAKNNAPTCNLVYKGMLSPGDSCTSSLDCAKPSGGDANCDPALGVCVVGFRGKLYDPCQQSCAQSSNGSIACVWGSASNPDPSGVAVTNCFANDGLLCGNTGQCLALGVLFEACNEDSNCSPELYCDSMRGYNCEPRRTLGQSCVEFTMPCVGTAYCNAGACVAKQANGQHCLSGTECLGICNCGLTGDCATSGVCTDPFDPVGEYIALLILAGSCSASQ